MNDTRLIRWFSDLNRSDTGMVGGKNASLGEMIGKLKEAGINVPEVPKEENPMLGWRGASRYYSEGYREGFDLECRAVRFAREEIGLDNIIVMIPFCRDSAALSALFDEQNKAVTVAITDLLAKARKSGTHTGICGQAPSDHPEFARFLVEHGIDSISVSPDSFLAVKRAVAQAERERDAGHGMSGRAAREATG